MTDLKNICGVQAAGEPPGASNSGYDAVTGARLSGLTNKAGMSFSFMRVMLATARSIQDSTLTIENARSALECEGLLPHFPRCGTSLLAVELCTVAWEARPRASSRIKAAASCPHSRAPAARSRCFERPLRMFSGQSRGNPGPTLGCQGRSGMEPVASSWNEANT